MQNNNLSEERRFYVYIWYIKDTDEVFYIGKGTGGRYKNTTHRNQYFKDMYKTHQCAVKKIYENLTEAEAFDKEMETIAWYKQNTNYRLTNQTDGGEGVTGWIPSQEWCDKIAESVRGENNPNYGNHWTEEMKKALSKKRKENGKSAGINNARATKIICLETGEIFELIQDAAIKYSVTIGDISTALHHPQKTAGGVHWKFYDVSLEDPAMRKNELEKSLSQSMSRQAIICVNDGTIYESKAQLSKLMSIGIHYIDRHLAKEGQFTVNNKTYMRLKDYRKD